ncbi:082L [Cherax quadricarinatus iridovirus]|uniref:ATP-dependent helicase n=1 Tax=Shrimp hemocyte iridescent virus TaxID=2039780 RepID=A0A291B0R0_9VIRU|nr:082L [Cherax quadricarinatus iridovirus]YP_010084822.1 ATP-dependent helicase [Shrimp hemocyte iridescent virus]ASZ85062.1 082L [Cherax quadricarinatus iridovirus]ATE87079.1 ATP-dependent helicase [Shrimp hemocyte iridescent virus]
MAPITRSQATTATAVEAKATDMETKVVEITKGLPETPPESPERDLPKYVLWENQVEIVDWMKDVETNPSNPNIKGGIIALKMGLGKTLIALHHCLNDEIRPSLIVTKKAILKEWIENGTSKFFDDINVCVLDKKASKDENLDEYDIVITTYSYLVRAHLENRRVMQKTWRRVIFDESHLLSNQATRTNKSCSSLNAEYKWCLTGTPICNRKKDLLAQYQICGYGGNIHSLNDNDLDKHIKIKDKTIPENNILFHNVPMTPVQREAYEMYQEELEEKLANCTTAGERLGAYGSAIMKFRQISIGCQLLGVEDDDKNEKAKKMLELVKASPNKTVIFSSFRKGIELISSSLEKEKISFVIVDGRTKKRDQVINDFKSDESIKCLIMNYKVGAEGFNIPEASSVILFDLWWNNAVHQQAFFRVIRPSQTKCVKIHFILTEDSYDDVVMKKCNEKQDIIKELNII